jgi:hypothetical protein
MGGEFLLVESQADFCKAKLYDATNFNGYKLLVMLYENIMKVIA